MSPAQAIRARNYVTKYGKKWNKHQVAQFFVEVARLCESADAKGAASDA